MDVLSRQSHLITPLPTKPSWSLTFFKRAEIATNTLPRHLDCSVPDPTHGIRTLLQHPQRLSLIALASYSVGTISLTPSAKRCKHLTASKAMMRTTCSLYMHSLSVMACDKSSRPAMPELPRL